eukprot:Awhi_evm1s12701
MNSQSKTFYFALLSLFCLNANACTDFIYKSNDGDIAVGRDMEFASNLLSELVTHPRGEVQSSLTIDPESNTTSLQGDYQWDVIYGYIGINTLNANITFDGMNEAGLACSILMLPDFADFQKVPKDSSQNGGPSTSSPNVLMQLNFCDWALAQFNSTEEVELQLPSILLWGITPTQFVNSPWFVNRALPPTSFDVHYSIHDKYGNSIVIEYTDGLTYKVHQNSVGVMTNSPPFDWHMYNLNQYIGLSGKNPADVVLGKTTLNKNYNENTVFKPYGMQSNFVGLPGSFSSQARFTRIALFLQTVAPTDDAVNVCNHLLNSVDVFLGSNYYSEVSDDGKETLGMDMSQWATIRDLTNKKFYFRSYNGTQWKVVDMAFEENADRFFTRGSPTYTMSVSVPIGAYNAASDFTESSNSTTA